ncbi:putative DNA helicase ino80 [Cichlidogyrus casuarinus]|uniref:DNA helicase ino80 n=1 Tax=Cichlidogyrus casuarinus TaxID=1844966 RepID=A0ABD2Q046_9PLAT
MDEILQEVNCFSAVLSTDAASKLIEHFRGNYLNIISSFANYLLLIRLILAIPSRDVAWKDTLAFLNEIENCSEDFGDVDEAISKWRAEAQAQLPKLTGNQRVNLIKDAGKVKARQVPRVKLPNSLTTPKKCPKPLPLKLTKSRRVRTAKNYDPYYENMESDLDSCYSDDTDFSNRLSTYVPRPLMSENDAKATLRRMCPRFLKLYRSIIKKFLLKAYRQKLQWRRDKIANARKASKECVKFIRQKAIVSQKLAKDYSCKLENNSLIH